MSHRLQTVFGAFVLALVFSPMFYIGYRLDCKLRADAQVPAQLARIADAMERQPLCWQNGNEWTCHTFNGGAMASPVMMMESGSQQKQMTRDEADFVKRGHESIEKIKRFAFADCIMAIPKSHAVTDADMDRCAAL